MLAAIAGDVIGSIYEVTTWKGADFENAECLGYDYTEEKTAVIGARAANFPLFRRGVCVTDDSVLTIAVMEWLLHGAELANTIKKWFGMYPNAGFGKFFLNWAMRDDVAHPGSIGNGAAMRVSPVAWAFETEAEVLAAAREQGRVTHVDSAVDGAEAIALGIFLLRKGASREETARRVAERYCYDLSRSIDSIRDEYVFSSACADTVPWVFRALLEARDFEDCVRRMISLGGDTDTMASMAAALAGTYWGVPKWIREETLMRTHEPMRKVLAEFEARYPACACKLP